MYPAQRPVWAGLKLAHQTAQSTGVRSRRPSPRRNQYSTIEHISPKPALLQGSFPIATVNHLGLRSTRALPGTLLLLSITISLLLINLLSDPSHNVFNNVLNTLPNLRHPGPVPRGTLPPRSTQSQ